LDKQYFCYAFLCWDIAGVARMVERWQGSTFRSIKEGKKQQERLGRKMKQMFIS